MSSPDARLGSYFDLEEEGYWLKFFEDAAVRNTDSAISDDDEIQDGTDGSSPNEPASPHTRNDLCQRCQRILLPNPGTAWSITFAKSIEVAVANYEAGCCFCGVVTMQLNPQDLNLDHWAFRDAKIKLVTLEDQPDKVHCRVICRSDNQQILAGALSVDSLDPSERPRVLWDQKTAEYNIHRCDSDHLCHTLHTNRQLPTRLLDLGSKEPELIKLVESSKGRILDDRYVALSYCWGSHAGNPFVTTPSNYAERLAGFATSDLPATLREAVQITRDLGIRYLWIDALCILQGSRAWGSSEGILNKEAEGDWQHESNNMDKVYGNAYFTIVAAGSSHNNGGLVYGSCAMPTRTTENTNNQNAKLLVLSVTRRSINTTREPIFRRAWAAQEWMLSPRLLVFTSIGMHFICNESEDRRLHLNALLQPRSQALFEQGHWQTIVENYCGRELTEPKDKLPAISGLAKLFFSITHGECGTYYAGLWEKSLLENILWKSARPQGNYGVFITSALRQRRGRVLIQGKPRAPSWSWAAVDGQVSFAKIPTTSTYPVHTSASLTCTVDSSLGHDRFGRVDSGILHVHCHYFPVAKITFEGSYFKIYNQALTVSLFWPDDPLEGEELFRDGQDLNLYCLGIQANENSLTHILEYRQTMTKSMPRVGSKARSYEKNVCWNGIVVVSDDPERKYFRRVGYFWTERDYNFDDYGRGDFKIR